MFEKIFEIRDKMENFVDEKVMPVVLVVGYAVVMRLMWASCNSIIEVIIGTIAYGSLGIGFLVLKKKNDEYNKSITNSNKVES